MPAPLMTTLTSAQLFADDFQRVDQAAEHQNRRAVVLVGEDRDVGRFSRLSAMVNARGAEMSSRQMAPKVGESAQTGLDDPGPGHGWPGRVGKASIPAKVLKMTLLPSSSGIAASGGPPSRPKRSEPSVRMATVLPRQVRSNDASGSSLDGETGFRDTGGVDEGEDGPVADRHLGADADQSLIAPAIVEPFLLELAQGSPSRDRLDRGGHTGHTTVPGLDLLPYGGFASACHQNILRCVVQGGTRLQRSGALLPDHSEPQARRLHPMRVTGS